MSDKYKIDDKEGIYFVTLTVVDWVNIFTRRNLKLTIVDSLKYCQKNKGLIIYAWCLMHNHLHMIVSSKSGFDLSGILRDMKKFTAKEIVRKMNDEPESRREWMLHRFAFNARFKKRIKNYKVWQDGNHAKQIITSGFMKEKLDFPAFMISLIEDDIVRVDFKKIKEMTPEHIDQLYSAVEKLGGGKKVGMISTFQGYIPMNNEVMAHSRKKEFQDKVFASASVLKSAALRMAVNFFSSFHKPKHPRKIFSSNESALKWLKQVRAEAKEKDLVSV